MSRGSGRGTPTTSRHPLASWLAILALGAVLVSACGEDPVLAVGPVEYTALDLGALGPSQRADLINITAFGLGIANGRVDEMTEPLVQRDLRSILLQRLAMEMAVAGAGLDETELEAAYRRDPAHELVVRHLVVLSERWRPEAHRDSARALAEEALTRARAGEDFAQLAAEYSDEPGAAERGGLLEPGREGSWVPEFWQAASSLEEGELSPVVETEYGFHVIRLEERQVIPFREMRDQVVERMVDLPRALGEAGSWARSKMEGAIVDTAAILEWAGGGMPSGALVQWPDADPSRSFTARDLEEYLQTVDPETAAAATEGTAEDLVDFVTSAATSALLLEHARELGIEPSDAQRAAIQQRWRQRVGRWAQALGLDSGGSVDAVKQGALNAVGSRQQAVMVARSELRELAGVLTNLYPIERAGSSSETG